MKNLIENLKKKNIRVNVIDENLELDIPNDVLADDLILEIKKNKEELISYIKKIKKGRSTGNIKSSKQKPFYNLSSAQNKLYFIYELDKTSLAYNMPQVVKFIEEVDMQQLNLAFKKLIERHESLRTSFHIVNDLPVQKIAASIDFKITNFEIKPSEIDDVIEKFIRPFDLSHPSLLRVGLIDTSSGEQLLMVDMHHIITDGTSQALLINDLMSFYNGEVLPNQKLQYKDYAEWQQLKEQKEEREINKEFWLKEFEEECSILDLPTDFSRPLVNSYSGDALSFSISSEQTRELQNIAKGEGATMFMLVLTIFNSLLSKLSGLEDIVVGTPISGRHDEDLEGIVGLFVNTLPLRNFPKSELNFVDFLSNIKSKTLDCFDNQHFQLEDLLEDLKYERTSGRNPIFDVLFSYQNFENSSFEDSGLSVEAYSAGMKTSKFDLTLIAMEMEDQLLLNFEYSTDIFKPETVKKFTKYFQRIVDAVTANPKVKLGEIDLLSVDEKNHLLTKFNNTKVDYPSKNSVLELFDETAQKHPNNIAQRYLDSTMTYLELKDTSEKIASYLIKEGGVSKGDLVGIILERESHLIPLIFGVLKAGAAYIPIDPRYPSDRINKVVEDSKLKLLVSRDKFKNPEINSAVKIISLDTLVPELNNITPLKEFPPIVSTDLAYIIYTSGSTGNPKGVMIEHSSLLNIIQTMDHRYPLNEKDSFLLKTTYAFDVSVSEIFGWFLSGGSLTVLPAGDEANVDALLNVIEDQQITHINFVPSMFSVFVEGLKIKGIDKIKSLKYAFLAGEALPLELVQQFNKLNTDISLENIYGPTEATIYSSGYSLKDLKGGLIVPIGKPLNNIQLYVLDKNQQLQPAGVPGELCIGGSGLARGYLNNEKATNEKFIKNPFLEGGRIYLTGDLARWLPDGNIEYLGRIDSQVKIRGYRMELGEIQHHLSSYKKVKEAVVVVKEKKNDKFLVGYYTSGENLETAELNKHLSGKMPDYMIPAYFIKLEKMPLSGSGKLNRKALPDPTIDIDGIYIAPSNETEETLVSIWSEILDIEAIQISVEKSFFELGGHSLRAAFMVNKIHKELSVSIPLNEVFNHPTIQLLGEYIDGSQKSEYVQIKRAEDKPYYPLAFTQKNQFFQDLYDTEFTNNMAYFYIVEGELDKKHLQDVFNKLSVRHETLRSYFKLVDEKPVQIFMDHMDIEIEHYSCEENQEGPIVKKFVRRFEVDQPPLFRAGLIDMGKNKHLLMVVMHHIISDGVSVGILARDFMKFFNNEPLPELKIRYRDFVEWQQSDERKVELSKHKDFWVEEFKDIPVIDLPADFIRPMKKTNRGDRINLDIKPEDGIKLRMMVKSEQTTLYMLLMSVFNIFLSKLTGDEDIVVGSPAAGRERPEFDDIAGIFISTISVRSKIDGSLTFLEFLAKTQEKVLSCLDAQAFDSMSLVNDVYEERHPGRNPYHDVFFLIENFEVPDVQLPELTFTNYFPEMPTAVFDLVLSGTESGEGVSLHFSYSTDLFKKETIRRFQKYLLQMISTIVENPDVKISDIDMTPPMEKNKLLYEFNSTRTDYPVKNTVLDLFDEAIEKNPNNIALRYLDSTMSYQKLQQTSEKIATYLISEAGVMKGDLVGIILERETHLIPLIFGILKAGAAYIPIDPRYPSERIKKIVEDSKMKLIVSRDKFKNSANSSEVKVVSLDTLVPMLATISPLKKFPLVDSTDLAYVIYTSGSMGNPKGVMIEHGSLLNIIQTMDDRYPLNETDNYLLKTTYAFDVSVSEIFGWFLSGGSITVLPAGEEGNVDSLLQTITDHQITHINFVPSMFSVFVNGLKTKGVDKMKSLKYIFLAGEEFPLKLVQQFIALNTNIRLENIYGPTEATIYSSAYSLENLKDEIIVPIGKPLNNTKLYVLDKNRALQPIGVPGELCIGGDGLARGYLNNEKATSEKFIENPFVEGERIYLTGDLARWMADGNLEFLGRIDNQQVKLRGYRIELGEVEKHLLDHPSIKEAVVSIMENGEDKSLIAHYISEEQLDRSELRDYLMENLPAYMVPSFFVSMETIPLTSSGKTDKKALPKPSFDIEEGYLAPTNETEEKLLEIWADILQIDKDVISIGQNFFELGGHSLNAITLIAKIEELFNVRILFSRFFNNPTIKATAKIILVSSVTKKAKKLEKKLTI